MKNCLLLLLAWTLTLAAEPDPRTLKPLPLKVAAPLDHVSAARELSNGRILITNAKKPSVLLIDPVTGAATPVGEAGGGLERYAVPGGLYAGPDGTTLLLDRGQTLVFTISPDGKLGGSRSIARRGHSGSSSADIDLQRLDAAGLAYFADRQPAIGMPPTPPKESDLIRFEAGSQKAETIARLRVPESRVISSGDGMVLTRTTIGSPADGWGVAPDGRVALVRAEPYRVEWLERDGRITRGPAIDFTPIPITDNDKKQYAASVASGGGGNTGVRIGRAGGPAMEGDQPQMLFAPTKAPFRPDDVLVSPDSRVWVMRAQPFGTTTVVYDVFDKAGVRTDRVALPDGSRIVGFGKGSVLVRYNGPNGPCELRKYGL